MCYFIIIAQLKANFEKGFLDQRFPTGSSRAACGSQCPFIWPAELFVPINLF